uniref:CUB domain-containing protein n=1 Tax=Macrostomum lignano TaxID=282301 RepID=A0A1I8FF03_9PLAT
MAGCPIPARSSHPCSTTYQAIFKGSSLIRMLERCHRRRVLKGGSHDLHLNTGLRGRNAASKDLVREAFRTREPHPGDGHLDYSGLTIRWYHVRISGNRLHFRQERFLLYPNNGNSDLGIASDQYLTDKTRGSPCGRWLDLEESKTVELDHTPAFVKINLNQDGPLQILFDQGQIRQTDAITIAVKFARRSGALDLVWTHFTRNWDQLLKIYEFDYERTREFFETHSLTSGKRNAYQSLESIRANIAWIKHNMESFKTFIKNKNM